MFKKGQSGNPGGRPKGGSEFQELARAHSVEAFNRIVELSKFACKVTLKSDGDGGMHEITEPDLAIRLKANQYICDRAWGRPAQALELKGKGNGAITVRIVRGK